MNRWMSRLALATLPWLAACAPQAYLIKQPAPQAVAAQPAAAAVPAGERLLLADERKGAERDFSTGTLPATLRTEAGPIDPPAFLAAALQAELAARGVALKVENGASGASGAALRLQSFRLLNHRTSGFSPFLTFTYLAADLDTPSGVQRVTSFVRRGKVPVWSFDEVIEPTFNQPLAMAVQELAGKIAHARYGWRASDAAVDAQIEKLKAARDGNSFLAVHLLGTMHNPRAIPFLSGLLKDGDEYVRASAMSALGMLKAQDQLPALKALYESREGNWADRAMALKAIGDIGGEANKAYLAQELKRWESQGDGKEPRWTSQIIRLFL
jgi:HEAT repeats